jgi:hypothetical protein
MEVCMAKVQNTLWRRGFKKKIDVIYNSLNYRVGINSIAVRVIADKFNGL